jgi:hypothetical protein
MSIVSLYRCQDEETDNAESAPVPTARLAAQLLVPNCSWSSRTDRQPKISTPEAVALYHDQRSRFDCADYYSVCATNVMNSSFPSSEQELTRSQRSDHSSLPDASLAVQHPSTESSQGVSYGQLDRVRTASSLGVPTLYDTESVRQSPCCRALTQWYSQQNYRGLGGRSPSDSDFILPFASPAAPQSKSPLLRFASKQNEVHRRHRRCRRPDYRHHGQ